MSTPINAILSDTSLSVRDRTRSLTTLLRELPDRGVPMAVQYILNSSEPAKATFPANYLALLPNFADQKREIVTFILESRPDLIIAAVNLVRDMPALIVERLLARCLGDPPSPDAASIIYEAALFHPASLRVLESKITDRDGRVGMLAGGPDDWVDALVRNYRAGKDREVLIRLCKFRTEKALDAIFQLWPSLSKEDQERLYPYVESSGVFPDSREASVYFKTYRGRVLGRNESPHPMGGQPHAGVPVCAICKTPANRILTLKADKLDFEIDPSFDPTFFWINCPHPQDVILVRFTAQGIEGILVPISHGPASEDLIPGELALNLEEHPNQFGYATEIIPGYGLHQVGGYPPWVKVSRFPRCPICRRGMRYLASVDCGMTLFGELPLGGMLYCFWCEECAVSATLQQQA